MTHWYRGLIQGKTRILLAWIFAAILCLSARHYPSPPGIIVCFVGATLRYWASGYLRKDSRPAVGGPYSLTRNPLYLGTYLMAIGAALAIQNLILFLVISVLFAAIYHYIILDEETKLERIFGEPYQTYRQLVPRFFPQFQPANHQELMKVNPEPTHHHFDSALANKNKAYEAYASFAGLIGIIVLIAWVWQRFLGG